MIPVSGSPPFHRSFVGFCCCSGCLGIPGRAGHRDCHNSQQRQHSQPWPPSTCAPTQKQNPKLGFHSCPKNHISPTAIWKKSVFRLIYLFLSSMEFSQHKKINKWEKRAKVVQGKSLRAHQGVCPKQLLLKDHYSRENLSSCVTGNVEIVLSSVFLLALLLFISYF